MLLVYLVFKFADTYAWAADVLPRSGLTFDQNFYQTIYGKWLLWSELFLCGVVPCVILLTPKLRNTPALFYSAALLDCAGITINRYVFTVQALAMPVMPFDSWEIYAPNWAEWGATALVIAYGAIILSLSYRYLPVFPQERALNATKSS
jgi:molybdopterin-containing oxidoreductase family membrane subunit